MAKIVSGLPDIEGLDGSQKSIYEFVLEKWPTTPLEVAENFNERATTREGKRRLSTKYAYHLKKLVSKRLIIMKKAGNSIIVWPFVVEKYRVIHDMLNDRRASKNPLEFIDSGLVKSKRKTVGMNA
ncbi:MAG: hypothetical protein AABW59_03980 [archaeon]